MPRYRKGDKIVEARQVRKDTVKDIRNWAGGNVDVKMGQNVWVVREGGNFKTVSGDIVKAGYKPIG